MKKVAVVFAQGFEEIEALTVVDVLRRAGISCDMLGFEASVTGSHLIKVEMDKVWSSSIEDYDMLVLPGGMPGAKHLAEHQGLLELLRDYHARGKWLAAICAAPTVFEAAGLLENKHYTCYNGFEEQIQSGTYLKEAVVVDGNLVTSRGPASALEFSYQLVDLLGGDASTLRQAMLYQDLFGKD